jgi:dCMP deaminase
MYVTYNPCWPCFKLIAGAGIKRICYGELYRDNQSFDFAKEAGVDLSNLVFEERL